MKKILVTGGAGFIGSHTAVALSDAGYIPVIADNFSNSSRHMVDRIRSLCQNEVVFYETDVCDEAALGRIFDEHVISGVIHFAAYKAVGESVERPLMYFENNIGSLIALLKVMQRHAVRDLVFSSSCTVYGIPDQLPVDETAPVKEANSPYGYTKQVGEQTIHYAVQSGQSLRSALLRYFNPIGAHHSAKIGELPLGVPNNLVPYIAQTAIGLRKELKIFGRDYDTSDGTCIRDYIHVMDLAEAHVKSLQWLETQSEQCVEVFNVGTGHGKSVQEIVDTFQAETGVVLNYDYADRRPGDVPAIFANASRANQQLKWKARFSLADALRHAWKWELQLQKERAAGG